MCVWREQGARPPHQRRSLHTFLPFRLMARPALGALGRAVCESPPPPLPAQLDLVSACLAGKLLRDCCAVLDAHTGSTLCRYW